MPEFDNISYVCSCSFIESPQLCKNANIGVVRQDYYSVRTARERPASERPKLLFGGPFCRQYGACSEDLKTLVGNRSIARAWQLNFRPIWHRAHPQVGAVKTSAGSEGLSRSHGMECVG